MSPFSSGLNYVHLNLCTDGHIVSYPLISLVCLNLLNKSNIVNVYMTCFTRNLRIDEVGYFLRYASESIELACDWAYKDATEGSVLEGKE